jgi:hypothetical protein
MGFNHQEQGDKNTGIRVMNDGWLIILYYIILYYIILYYYFILYYILD